MSQGEIEGIIDALSLYPLLRRLGGKATEHLTRLAVLDLTKYEIGNAVCKEYGLGSLKSWEKAIESWSRILEEMKKLSIGEREIKDAERIAIERDLTLCDASYVFLAESKNLKLVTEDEELLNSCKNAITLKKLLEAKTQLSG
jgi:predicted nucleic acid-binding protein